MLGVILISGVCFSGCENEEVRIPAGTITVKTREEGSGTRSSFVDLFGIYDAEKNDNTTKSAELTNNAEAMMSSVQKNKNAIGYVSMGSMNDSVKALKIDGARATKENVANGSYLISRPFNLAISPSLTKSAGDFLLFILSNEGQDVVASKGYVKVEGSGPYQGTKPIEKILVSGSSSITPLMEALKEAYLKKYPDAEIEIQTGNSATGLDDAINGVSDLGMVSRNLKDFEIENQLFTFRIAIDGIAVIVNKSNAINDLTREQVMGIYKGEITAWGDLGNDE